MVIGRGKEGRRRNEPLESPSAMIIHGNSMEKKNRVQGEKMVAHFTYSEVET